MSQVCEKCIDLRSQLATATAHANGLTDLVKRMEERKLIEARKDAERLTIAFEPLLQMLAWNRVSGNCTPKERDAIFNVSAAIAASKERSDG